ncbi:MAG: SseB family protein [Methylococcales bacterium]|jgi:hypothetical protein|nr:SseB family protein [Methylococcales bacterium]
MTTEFIPRNELEQQLMDVHQGKISTEVFMQFLQSSQVFMPARNDDEEERTYPLKLNDEEGIDVLILFTSPERARPFVNDFPGYENGLLAEFTWVIEKMGTGYGISINPDSEIGIDLEPDILKQLAATND